MHVYENGEKQSGEKTDNLKMTNFVNSQESIPRDFSSVADIIPEVQSESHQNWESFTQESSFHGVKYIFDKRSNKTRRLLWTFFVLVAVGLFSYQAVTRTLAYFSHDTTVNVEVVQSGSLMFPAVTICNQNMYRITEVVKENMYETVDGIYSGDETHDEPMDFDIRKFTLKTAHQVADLIYNCKWLGRSCNISADFVKTVTDYGVCYTFNSGIDQPVYHVGGPGTSHGLSLLLNAEQYEYMKGPHNDAGVKILLHSQFETPLVNEIGFAVAPGTHTLVGTKMIRMEELPHPHGECDPTPNKFLSTCLAECRSKSNQRKCGCVELHMDPENKNLTKLPVCNLYKSAQCLNVEDEQEEGTANNGDNDPCTCSTPCIRASYDYYLSYSQISKLNANQMLSKSILKSKALLQKFHHAQEISQRHIDIFSSLNKNLFETVFSARENVSNIVTENLDGDYVTLSDLHITVTSDSMKLLNQLADLKIKTKADADIVEDFREYAGTRWHLTQMLAHDSLYTAYNWDERKEESRTIKVLQQCLQLNISLQNCGFDFHGQFTTDEEKMLKTVPNIFDVPFLYRFQHNPPKVIEVREAVLSLFAQISDINNDSIAQEYYDHCLERLDDIYDWSTKLGRIFNNFTKVESVEEGIELLELGIQNAVKLYEELQKKDQSCMWLKSEFYTTIDGVKDGQNKYNASYLETEMINKQMQTELTKFAEIVSNELFSLTELIHEYEENTYTMFELDATFNDKAVSKLLQKTISTADNIASVYASYKSQVNWMAINARKMFSVLEKSHVAQSLIDFKGYEILEFLQNLQNCGPTNVGIQNEFASLASDQAFESFLLCMDTRILEITELSNIYISKVEAVRKMLREFVQASVINEIFYRENFLQVDIYYMEMSYEKIRHQVAFTFISLLSEIGGLLGLLLGASCLTIMELMDYLTVGACGKACRKTNKYEK